MFHVILSSFALVALGEMGDKTQLLALGEDRRKMDSAGRGRIFLSLRLLLALLSFRVGNRVKDADGDNCNRDRAIV